MSGNLGAERLRACGASLDEIASAAACTRTTAARYRSGEKVPSARRRERLKHWVRDPGDFDRVTSKRAATAKAVASPMVGGKREEPAKLDQPASSNGYHAALPEVRNGAEAVGRSAEARLQAQLVRLDQMRCVADLSPAAQLSVEHLLVRVHGELARATGESSPLDERRILRSPAWRVVKRAVLAALRPWPEAIHAVGKALEALEHG